MNKTRRLIVTTLALLTTLLGFIAAEASEGRSCTDSPAGEFAECLGIQTTLAETELAKVYDSVLRQNVSLVALNRVKDAQTKWRSYRDAQCDLAGFEPNASRLFVQQCLLQFTEDRISALRELNLEPVRRQAER
jgi:uncharacterized protein YecT (DUF1311 family)